MEVQFPNHEGQLDKIANTRGLLQRELVQWYAGQDQDKMIAWLTTYAAKFAELYPPKDPKILEDWRGFQAMSAEAQKRFLQDLQTRIEGGDHARAS